MMTCGKWYKCVGFLVLFVGFLGIHIGGNYVTAQSNNDGRFSSVLEETTTGISKHLDVGPTEFGAPGAVNFIIKKVIDVLFPIVVILGILIAIIGFYKYFTSQDTKVLQNAIRMILAGIIGILLMFSASYISNTIFYDIFLLDGTTGNKLEPLMIITNLYNKLVFPFIKIGIYLALGILVLVMISRVISYIFSTEEAAKKKAMGVIIWTTVGMLFIIASKQIVEAVYGKQSQVLESYSISNLGSMGSSILQAGNIPIIYQIINRALALVSFVVLVMIIIQTFKMITKPNDTNTLTGLKKTILYSLIGIVVIGAAYIIANLLVPN